MEEINLMTLFSIIRKRLWIIVLSFIAFITISSVLSYYVLPLEYQTYTTLMIGQSKDNTEKIGYSDIQLSRGLVTTYRELAKSKIVANQLISRLKLNTSYEELKKKINVVFIKDTEIIMIKVTDTSPELAAAIANETANIFKEYIVRIMKVDNIQIIDKAEIPQVPISPKPLFNIAIAGFIGIMLGSLIIFLIEYLDNTVKIHEDVEKYLELPVIGMIPKMMK